MRRSTGGVVRRAGSHHADLAVHLVGRLCVRCAGERLTGTDIGSRKARILSALLAMQRNRLVRRDHIVAAAALVDTAETRLAGREPLAAHTVARRALDLLDAGGVLEDEPYETWAEPARARHRALLRRARHSLAASALRLGASAAAGSAAASALADDRLDEAACRLLMQAYNASGEPIRALDVYQRLRDTLAEELGLDPAPATHDLYVAILRGQASPRDART